MKHIFPPVCIKQAHLVYIPVKIRNIFEFRQNFNVNIRSHNYAAMSISIFKYLFGMNEKIQEPI